MPLPLYEYSGTVYTDIPPGTVKFPLVTKDGWPISFLEAIHIHVYKTPDQGESLQELQRPADWNFNTEQTEVVLASPLPAGNALIIRRITPDDNPYVVYAEGTLLTAEQLNRSDQWALCLFQESKDNFTNGLGVITGAMIANGTITDVNISDTAEIAVNKLANGTADQVLHTTPDGTGVLWRDLTPASTTGPGVVQLSTSTSSTSTTEAATPSAVKEGKDEALAAAAAAQSTANAAMPKAGGTFTGDVNFGTTTATKLPVGTTAQRPTGATGLVRFNTTISQYEGYNGTAWSPIGGGAKVSATAPSPATDGMQWYDLNDGRTYVYVNDGDSSQWVDASPPVVAELIPPGTVQYFAGQTAPSGWLKADGALISRVTYANLFAAIGTLYGAGDGSTTFALPDLRGEFLRGWDDGRGADTGRAFGSAQAQAMQQHRHEIALGHDGNNIYGWSDANDYPAFGSRIVSSARRVGVPITVSNGNIRIGYTSTPINETGETRPRNIALLAIIKF